MTRINRKVVRLTAARFRGEEIVVELHPTAVFVRTKRSPEGFPILYADLFEIAAMRHAKSVTGFGVAPRTGR